MRVGVGWRGTVQISIVFLTFPRRSLVPLALHTSPDWPSICDLEKV